MARHLGFVCFTTLTKERETPDFSLIIQGLTEITDSPEKDVYCSKQYLSWQQDTKWIIHVMFPNGKSMLVTDTTFKT